MIHDELLARLIHDALAQTRGDPRHFMKMDTRAALFRAIGPPDRHGGPGHQRRIALAVKAARRALVVFPGDEWTDRALDLAPRIWTMADGRDQAFDLFSRHGSLDHSELQGNPADRPRAARVAAYEVLFVGIRDEPAVYEIDLKPFDDERDALDTAGLAAVAIAGAAGTADDDPRARLEFWEWYLEQIGERS